MSIQIPFDIAMSFCDVMADGTIENPISEHSTCPEYGAMQDLLHAFVAAGVPFAEEAQAFQREGHDKSYVCSEAHC